jgi:hypothetical protein
VERPDIPRRGLPFFGDVPEDIDMDDDALLVAEGGRKAAKDEAGKSRDDRRVSLV